jgi:hypothetical protein
VPCQIAELTAGTDCADKARALLEQLAAKNFIEVDRSSVERTLVPRMREYIGGHWRDRRWTEIAS